MSTQHTNPNRVPAGVKTGGQFATGSKTEADVTLSGGTPQSTGGPVVTADNLSTAMHLTEMWNIEKGADELDVPYMKSLRDKAEKAFNWQGPRDDDEFFGELRKATDTFDWKTGVNAPEQGSDWDDDFHRFGNDGAFITLASDSGEYTDFQLTPEQVQGMFGGIARSGGSTPHPGGGVSVSTFIARDGAKVYQIDTEGDGDHVRINVNDSTLYDGRVGIDDNPGQGPGGLTAGLNPEQAAEQVLASYPFEREDYETERDVTEVKMVRALADLQHYAQANGIEFRDIVSRAQDVVVDEA